MQDERVEIAIVKSDGRKHRCVVARPDGTTARFAVHDDGAALPHDLVHFSSSGSGSPGRAERRTLGAWS